VLVAMKLCESEVKYRQEVNQFTSCLYSTQSHIAALLLTPTTPPQLKHQMPAPTRFLNSATAYVSICQKEQDGDQIHCSKINYIVDETDHLRSVDSYIHIKELTLNIDDETVYNENDERNVVELMLSLPDMLECDALIVEHHNPDSERKNRWEEARKAYRLTLLVPSTIVELHLCASFCIQNHMRCQMQDNSHSQLEKATFSLRNSGREADASFFDRCLKTMPARTHLCIMDNNSIYVFYDAISGDYLHPEHSVGELEFIDSSMIVVSCRWHPNHDPYSFILAPRHTQVTLTHCYFEVMNDHSITVICNTPCDFQLYSEFERTHHDYFMVMEDRSRPGMEPRDICPVNVRYSYNFGDYADNEDDYVDDDNSESEELIDE